MSGYLDRVVSVVPRATDHRPHDHVTVADALEQVRSGRYRVRVEQIRQLADKKARQRAKRSLPAFTFAGRFSYANRDGLLAPSGLVCLDADDLDDRAATREALARSPHVLAVFDSPSGEHSQGLKVLVPVAPPPEDNDQNHQAYAAAAHAVGLTQDVDASTKDVSRLCYVSWDPRLHLNPDAVPVEISYSVEGVGREPRTRAERGPRATFTRLEEGRKYETLRHLGGLLRYGGASGDVIGTALQAVRLAHSDDPGDAEPVERLAEWLGDLEPDERGTLTRFLRDLREPEATPSAPGALPFVPFPTDALPAVVAAYVRGHAAALNVDEAAVAVPVLPALAAAVGNSYEAEPKRGWRERAAVWACLIQPSGTLKSQSVFVAVAPALALEREAAERYRAERDEYEGNLSQWNELTKAQKRETPKPPAPERVRYRTGDTTIESLGAVHADAPRGVLGYRDELSGWLGSFDRYARGDADMANWMEMCGGRPVVIDRKSSERGVLYVEAPNVSMVGTIQPSTLAAKLGPGHFASGFAARLLLTEPPTRPRRWNSAAASVEVDGAYHDLVRRLYREPNGSGVLPFGPEAVGLFAAFYDENGATLGRLPDGPLRASLSKIEGYAVRLALVFHLCDAVTRRAAPGEVSAEAVERAVVVARWLRYEQARVYRLHGFDRLALDADERKALALPETFAWQDVAEVWSVGKSGAYVVLGRLIEKRVAEDAGHGKYRRADGGRVDSVDYGLTFDPKVHNVQRSTDHSGDGTALGDPAVPTPPFPSTEAPF